MHACILTLISFNAYSEYIMSVILNACDGWILIGGTNIFNSRYSDDTVVPDASQTKLKMIMKNLIIINKQFGLTLKTSTTNVMIIIRSEDVSNINSVPSFEIIQNFYTLRSGIIVEPK